MKQSELEADVEDIGKAKGVNEVLGVAGDGGASWKTFLSNSPIQKRMGP